MKNTLNPNSDIVIRFSRLLNSGRMAHAYLFTGPQGIGKSETALSVAKMLNCEERLAGQRNNCCDRCPVCIKVNNKNHPDVFWIDCGQTDSIKIAQIREVISRLQMRAFEAATKVCIIKDIEKMTLDSSNAFLKTLEEPSKDTVLILTTSVPQENLQTVVSRCHVIKFYPLSISVLRDRLLQDKRLSTHDAQSLAQFSQGCAGLAADLHEQHFIRTKNEVIDNLVFSKNNDAYLKKVLNDKPQTRLALSVLLSWFRDLLILKSGGGKGQTMHPDRYEELLTLEKKYSFDKISGIIDELVNALALLGENLNIKIPFIVLREKIWVK